MKLRIHRTFQWELAIPLSEVRLGGRSPYKLVATDVLEEFVEDYQEGHWVPVDVFEEPKPENPQDKRDRERTEALAKEVDRIVRKMLKSKDLR